MIRLICRNIDVGAAANVGGPVNVSHKTFDIRNTEVEAWLKEAQGQMYQTREVSGAELLPDNDPSHFDPTEMLAELERIYVHERDFCAALPAFIDKFGLHKNACYLFHCLKWAIPQHNPRSYKA